MKFLKENSYDVVKFFIYQIGIAVFSLTLAIPLSAATGDDGNGKLVQLGVSALAVIFYSILVYTVSWEHGAIDRIKIDGGKSSLDIFKCAKIALIANIPNFILSAFAALSALLYTEGNAWASVLGILLAILGLIESMYLGTVQFAVAGIANPSTTYYLAISIGFFVLPFVMVFASHIGYVFGDKGIRIFGFASKNKPKNKM